MGLLPLPLLLLLTILELNFFRKVIIPPFCIRVTFEPGIISWRSVFRTPAANEFND